MRHTIWIWLAILPALIETLILLFKPNWMVWSAKFPITERTLTLSNPRHAATDQAGYRDPAKKDLAVPQLEMKRELSDAVLFCTKSSIALRRAYGLGRRQIWLVGIEIERVSDTLVMRALYAPTPLSLIILVPAVVALMPWKGVSVVGPVAIWMAMVAGIMALNHFLTLRGRNVAIEEAFDCLESELRTALEDTESRAEKRSM